MWESKKVSAKTSFGGKESERSAIRERILGCIYFAAITMNQLEWLKWSPFICMWCYLRNSIIGWVNRDPHKMLQSHLHTSLWNNKLPFMSIWDHHHSCTTFPKVVLRVFKRSSFNRYCELCIYRPEIVNVIELGKIWQLVQMQSI